MASANEKASMAIENNSPFNEGFLDVPFIKAANIIPAPIAPPPTPIVANPPPINLAAPNIIKKIIYIIDFYYI